MALESKMELEVLTSEPAGPHVGHPLLLVHGVCHGAWCWARWADWFSSRGRVVHALSLRGHGYSAGRESLDEFGLDDYREDVLRVARKLEAPVLVAHSMGGAVAQLAVAAKPSLFSGLVLLAPPPPDGLRISELLRFLGQVPGLLRLMKLAQGKKLSASEVQRLPFFDGRISTQEAAQFSEQLQRESKKASREASAFRAPAFKAGLPVLVGGSLRDRLLAVSALKRTAKFYFGNLFVLDAACHDLMLDGDWEKGAVEVEGWLVDRAL